jgi:DNA polymerase-1
MNSPSGKPVHALHGLARSIIKLVEDFKPDHLVAVFDGKEAKKRRKEIYAEYKAHRAAVPQELIDQIIQAPQMCQALGLQVLIDSEHEADDLIAAACDKACEKEGYTVYICSSDKDLLQLVEPHVYQLHTHKENKLIGPGEVKALLGVQPSQVADWLALCGDSSDNIPGVEGIGPKTAAQLLEKWGTLENLIEHLDDLGPKKKEKFNVEMARISKQLATLFSNFEFELNWTPFQLAPSSCWKPLLNELGLRSIIKSLSGLVPEEKGAPVSVSVPGLTSDSVQNTRAAPGVQKIEKGMAFQVGQPLKREFFHQTDLFDLLPVQEPVTCAQVQVPARSIDWEKLYQEVQGLSELSLVHLEPMAEDFWAVWTQDSLWFIEQRPTQDILRKIQKEAVRWQTSQVQRTHRMLEKVAGSLSWLWHDDLVIAAHLFYADGRSLDPAKSLGHALGMLDDEVETLFERARLKEIDALHSLRECFQKAFAFFTNQLDVERLWLYREVEVPLASVLARMHRRGFHVNLERLQQLSREMHIQLEELKAQIIEGAGESFNLNSPKQLAVILFEKLALPVVRKTKTGASTDNETLQELEDKHPIISLLLRYRELEKLRSTYIDALPSFIQEDGRIHPYFEQSTTATGRLSCHQPNLQNIPVRTNEGLKIRSAFTANSEPHRLLSADYSQIELRVMAHLSEDSSLIEAFNRGEDIHRYTAALVFGKEPAEVLDQERSLAKAVNFGIIYGQQAFGLSKQINVPLAQASQFIHAYFDRYPGVKRYLSSCKEQALSLGYVKTILGRRRPIPEMKSPKHTIRQLGERLSINTPVQGSAAELIKLAMLKLEKELEHESVSMILQVHDELIFEGAPADLDRLKPKIQEVMESVISLRVPLVVNINIGKNWMEC